MNTINGRAKKYNGAAIDYALVFKWEDGSHIGVGFPDATGAWSVPYYAPTKYGVTYVADGCEPISHGAYDFVPQWEPLYGFLGGKKGALYDPRDLTTLFQDTAMAIPVTTSGQSVAAMLDKSGNGNHLYQSSANRRPKYIKTGNKMFLRFDGVDDVLITNNIVPLKIPVMQGLYANVYKDMQGIFFAMMGNGFLSSYASGYGVFLNKNTNTYNNAIRISDNLSTARVPALDQYIFSAIFTNTEIIATNYDGVNQTQVTEPNGVGVVTSDAAISVGDTDAAADNPHLPAKMDFYGGFIIEDANGVNNPDISNDVVSYFHTEYGAI